MSFQDLKKKSSKGAEELSKLLEKESKPPQSFKDERIWSVERDKTGNGSAIIRFLPSPPKEEFPFVKVFSHSFKGPSGSWYIENCPTTLGYGNKCPICEDNSRLWNSGLESDKKIASERKRKLRYFSNILVISDPAHRENEGKVFLYSYGKKIFDKITESMQKDPTEPDKVVTDPFDLWNGRNFKIKVKTIAGYPNYDDSRFMDVSPVAGGDEKAMEKIWLSQYSLLELAGKDKFKDYTELMSRFKQVLSVSSENKSTKTKKIMDDEDNLMESEPLNESNAEDSKKYLQKLLDDEE